MMTGLRHGMAIADAARARLAPALIASAAGRGRLAGEDAELIVAGVDRIELYVARFLPLRRAAMLSPLLVALAAFPASWVAAAILLATLIPFAIGMALAGGAAHRASEDQLGALSRLGGLFVDRVRALPLILSCGAEDRVTRHIDVAAQDLATRTLGVLRVAFVSSAILEFFSALAVALVAVYCGFSLLGLLPFAAPERLDFARAFFVLALAPEFYVGMRRLAAAYHEKQQGVAAMAAIAMRLESFPPAPTSIDTPKHAARLALSSLVVRHPEGAAIGPVTAGWNGPGLHLIMGPSGSGKTSLLRALIGQVAIETGEMRMDEVALDPAAIAPHCGWAGQRALLLPDTLRRNLLLDQSGTSEHEALALLDTLGLDALIAARGSGLDWAIDDRGSGLSGGERRRIGLARALLAPRPILLLDEPTADLDAENADGVVALLEGAAETRLLIVATHDPRLAAIADSVVELA
ncbi:cysteine ABC transporter permease [Sphingopyxis sp. H071]|nr:cysteine ABC transporter permease [Sphingopyxis sp. H057]KTE50274.1 cysteine ABC transporter permease [Sphingopyxis sp. H073]KTE50659.1 cysteine ABC transporter permease [Sphingopyxis sp. H071]KTE59946.1 cysteine ABC transporter permease [Sphingopyxis sp. H107]KTE63727.1 cysteine ABC transporter permease [Sphingopyxis sp. H100]KTE71815.1 cysteine ABC transporter permease [Sphingopyxis sp. H081]KTE83096.1 cysteine ABC transporter permease [Sphingopyxis sp. H067]